MGSRFQRSPFRNPWLSSPEQEQLAVEAPPGSTAWPPWDVPDVVRTGVGHRTPPVPPAWAHPSPDAQPNSRRPPAGEVAPLEPGQGLPSWTGPVRAWTAGYGPNTPSPAWWWLGCHGGAGVSTLAAFIRGGADAGQGWPDPAHGGPAQVVLVARSSAHGLRCALSATRQWAAHAVPAVELVGAVVVADAPGRKLYPAQTEQLAHLRGVLAAVWVIPWLEELRVATPAAFPAVPPAISDLGADLATLAPPLAAPSRSWETS